MPEQPYLSELASYSNLFQRMLDCAFLLDQETFRIRDANCVAERVLETDREQLVGQDLSRWLKDGDGALLHQCFRSTRRRYYPWTQNFEWQLPGGPRLMKMMFCQLTLSDPRKTEVIQIIAQDITAEREAQRQAERYLNELKALSITDEMTRLFNYRYFKEQLAQEQRRAARFGAQYSIVFCDVDHFKHFNDRNGHPAGDALLKQLAGLIKSVSREVDIPARYGGEEFVILCPGTHSVGAYCVAERLRQIVETTPFAHGDGQPLGKVTISVGVAAYPEHGTDETSVLKAADAAVYVSKHGGRNRVSSATSD